MAFLPNTLTVDIVFTDGKPGFGDLFCLTGASHPSFPPEGFLDFSRFDDLAVSQIDDYFGVRTLSGEGTDVAIWLYPLVGGKVVDHHPGPFDGVRLDYDLLGNPTYRLEHFLKMLTDFETDLPVSLRHGGTACSPDDVARIAEAAIRDWREAGLEPGSPEALARDT